MADYPPSDLLTPPDDIVSPGSNTLAGPPPDLQPQTLANQGSGVGSDIWSFVQKAAPYITAGTPGTPRYNAGVSGAWSQLGSDVAATVPKTLATSPLAALKQEAGEGASLAKVPYDVFGLGMSLTGIPQAFGAANEAAGAGVAKVLPSLPGTPYADVGKSFNEMLGTAEQLGIPAKIGPIQTVLDKLSGGPPPEPPPPPGQTINGTYRDVTPQSGPQRTLANIANGKPPDAPAPTAAPGGPPADLQAPAGPVGTPAAGEAVGLRYKAGPPRRATVDHYFDNGNAVRLRMDDGSIYDLTTADLLKNRTEPPAPVETQPAPASTGPQLGIDEAPFPPDDLIEAPPARRVPPPQAPLGGDMLNALDHADALEKTALNQALKLSGGSRQDMLAEAARLRRLYGHQPDADMPPNAYVHPMAGEPAADLGALAAARVAHPDLYQGPRAVPPPNVSRETMAVDPYALEDVQRARGPMPKGKSLFDAMRDLGGIKDDGGDVRQIMQGYRNPPFIRRVFNPDSGLHPDDVRSALQEQGWFGNYESRFGPDALPTGSYPGDDLQDLYDLMDREARGEKIYHPDSDTAFELEHRRQLDEDLGRAGAGDSDSNEVAARKLAEYRQSELAARDAWERSRASHQEISPEAEQGLAAHGYEPGADIGAEFENAGGGEEGAEGPPPDLISEGGNYEPGESVAGPEPDHPEDYTGEREDIGRRVEQGKDLFAAEPGAVDAQGRPVPQTIIPGAEKSDAQRAAAMTDRARAEMEARQKQSKLRRGNQQEPGGLFGEEKPQKGLFEQPANRFEEGRPPFYSALTRAVEGVKMEKAPPGQWEATIKNLPGVKAEEVDWSGVNDWLRTQTKSVTKAEVLAHLRENEVRVQGESVMGGQAMFQPGAPTFSSRAGEAKDLAPEFSDWLKRGAYPDTGAGLSDAVREYLLNRGAVTEHEALGLHDLAANAITHMETSGNPNAVQFSDAMAQRLMDPNANIITHHNHPSSRSLSAADLGTLAYPGHSWVVAHGHDGNFFAARLSPKWRAAVRTANESAAVNRNSGMIRNAVTMVENALYPHFRDAVKAGHMTAEEANDALNHATMQAMAQHGTIDYVSSKELAPHVQAVAAKAIQQSTKVPLGRSPQPVRYEEGIGRVLGERQGSAAGRSGAERSGVQGQAGAGKSGVTQLQLLQDQPRYPSNPAEAADRRDSAADAMAEELRTSGSGTYARLLNRMGPPSGDRIYKDPNAVQNVTIRPETISRLDTRSAAKWNAEKAKDAHATTMVDDLRERIAGTMLKLPEASRNKVFAARELDRINGQTRADTGHQIVARNDGATIARLSKPGDVVTLNPQETAAYHALTDMFDRAWKNIMEGAARKVGWEGAWDKDDMAANIATLTHAAENSVDRGTAKTAQRAAAIVNTLDAQRRQAYHPLMRFGDYFAHVTPKIGTDMSSTGGFPKTVWFELAERGLADSTLGGSRVGNQSPPYAKEMLGRLAKQYPADKFDIEHGYLAKNPDMLDRVDIPAIEKLMTFMENDMLHSLRAEGRGRGMSKADAAAYATQKYDDLYGRLVDQLWEKAFQELQAGYRKQSRTVGGYSDDFGRALGTYMHWTSRNVADQIHRPAIDEADVALQTDPRVNPNVKRYWQNWNDYQKLPSNIFNKGVNGMARWGFLTAMGVNPSSSAVVGMHGLFMAGPTLSTGIGMAKAAPAFSKALGHAMSAVKVGKDGIAIPDVAAAGRTPAEKAFLRSLDAEGVLHSRAVEDMAALNEKQSSLWGSARSTARKMMDLALSNVSVMDRANRIASALSAYRLAGDPKTLAGMDAAWRQNQIWRDRVDREGVNQESMARFMVPNMVGEYGRMNQAPIERNAISRMMLGMHSFVTRLLGNMWKLGSMGPDGQRALMWTLGAFWLMAGLDGTPFAEDVQNGANELWKVATRKDPMIGYRIQAGLATVFGKVGAQMILHGPSSALGVDLGSRLGLGDLISRNLPTAENVLGAYPSIIWGRVAAAASDVSHGHPGRAPTEFLPAGVRNVLRAGREAQEGVTSGSGRVEVPASEIGPTETIGRGLGFTPEKAEEAYERGDYLYRARRAKMSPPQNPIPRRKGGRAA